MLRPLAPALPFTGSPIPWNTAAIAAIGLLCLSLSCCNDPKPAPQSRSSKIANAEELATLYTPDGRERAREAAAQYLAGKGMIIRGMSAIEVDGSNYAVTADLGDGTPMMQLAVRQFFTEDGARYWKAVPLDPITASIYGVTLSNARAGQPSEPAAAGYDRERF